MILFIFSRLFSSLRLLVVRIKQFQKKKCKGGHPIRYLITPKMTRASSSEKSRQISVSVFSLFFAQISFVFLLNLFRFSTDFPHFPLVSPQTSKFHSNTFKIRIVTQISGNTRQTPIFDICIYLFWPVNTNHNIHAYFSAGTSRYVPGGGGQFAAP